jgi:hypothetical protein
LSATATTTVPGRSAPEIGELWIHPRIRRLPIDLPGPFVRNDRGELVTVTHMGHTLRWSSNEGATWTEAPLRNYVESEKEFKISKERSLIKTRSGTLVLGFMNLNEMDWRWDAPRVELLPGARLPLYATRSTDGGRTWDKPQRLHDEWTGDVRNMIQLRCGRIVMASQRMRNHPGRNTVLTYYSDDEALTWKASNTIDLGGAGHHGGVMEGTIEELPDGAIVMLIRTNWQQFWRAISRDGGASWRDIQPSGIDASCAPGLLTRLASGRIMLLWNRLYPEGKSEYPMAGGINDWSEVACSKHREEMSLAWYDTATHTISNPVVIARQPGAGLAYPRVFENQPGELWVTTMFGGLRLVLLESDFVSSRP